MRILMIGIILFIVSMVVSLMTYWRLLKFAKVHHIVDNPALRKLQNAPVPVMGGEAVFAGILAGGMLLRLLIDSDMLTYLLIGMAAMMIVGLWDDVKEISVSLRFIIEIAWVSLFIAVTGVYIDNFYGLWGIYELSPWVGMPLSIFGGVGIINSINLIDGVDGYSSGFVMFACAIFGVAFWTVQSLMIVCLALIAIGALIPFFMHNVFGKKTKMFLGDSGTLMLGVLMAVLVFFAMSTKQNFEMLINHGVGLGSFVLAVMCIPVFDTIRVMTLRILRGKSPFSPDKTHLHHLFLEMGFSHLGTVVFILLMNAIVVLLWYMSYMLGASIDTQLYLVIIMGFVVTFGFYQLMKTQQAKGTVLWHVMCRIGGFTWQENNCIWRFWACLIDEPILRKCKNVTNYD